MDTKLCRICGKLSENYVHIFKTEGLKNKIETCLPIFVTQFCLLPDTICSECLENVDNFYSFIKNCLQNIIVLEAQYDITESCLKTKRKHEKGCLTDLSPVRYDKNVQTDEDFADLFLNKGDNLNYTENTFHFNYLEMEKLSIALFNAENILNGREPDTLINSSNIINHKHLNRPCSLVNYEVDSESEIDENDKNIGQVVLIPKPQIKYFKNRIQKKYFDDVENNLINEIAQRKFLKRKNDNDLVVHRTKIAKIDTYNRRKNRQPKKLEYLNATSNLTFNKLEKIYEEMEAKVLNADKIENSVEEVQVDQEINNFIPQLCLLCDLQFMGPTMLASHLYEVHGIDMAQIMSNERKKKIPNLVKIADLKAKDQSMEGPPTLQPTFVCPICPAVMTNRSDLFTHLKVKHSKHAALLCGLCLYVATSYANLTTHLETCKSQHSINSRYICKICSYHDDNSKTIENHVAVHDFILAFCKKQPKMFDPCDYIEINSNCENAGKTLTCTECNQDGFVTFKEFSTHRRSQHQIFHCDLCNKFYGRNSHLWKHVNRLHKGHPSITCQLCYKTSASKYHLAQHFNKIHTVKSSFKPKTIEGSEESTENFMNQKFQGFDFQSVRQSFMKQDLLEQERKCQAASDEGVSDDSVKVEIKTEEVECSDLEIFSDEIQSNKPVAVYPPKEIDASSDLYTNIITNYTPPQNEGEYKCPKCFKGFHKKTLLKKHKKNCRPRLQKDLLTRCKTCSRIFKDRQSLTKHLINYHSEYACEICGQKVQSKCEIVSHIRFSHPNCHLFCHCGNILRSKIDLLEHKEDHRNSFVCQFCADMLPTKIKLKMHILSLHRKILSLSCGICLKLFETQHILRDHVRLVHKDELLPLTSCTVCGKNYGSKWKTYDHLNKSHGRIFKACKSCLDVFDTEEQLQSHFETAHVNVLPIKSNVSLQNISCITPNTSIVKRDLYESDALEETEKNSSSEFSNDIDEFSQYNVKGETNLSEEEEVMTPTVVPSGKPHDYLDIASVENKISLLEKRLLGNKKLSDGESNVQAIIASFSQNKNTAVLSKKVKVEEAHIKPKKEASKDKKSTKNTELIIKKDMDMDLDSNPQTPLQNSSKRTVYVNSNDPSLCEICLKTWPAKKHLWQHYIRCHKTVAATVCGICLKTNDCYESLQIHLRENHPTLLHGQGFGSNFICRICGRYHNASSKLKLHMAIHENFNWSILEEDIDKKEVLKETSTNGYLDENGQLQHDSMYYGTSQIANQDHDDINYESLIEQVECSSDSDMDEDKFLENHHTKVTNSSFEDESDDNESTITVSEENSLESQMLQNMLKEKFATTDTKVKEADNRREYSSSDSEESSDSNESISDTEGEVQVKSSTDEDNSRCSITLQVTEKCEPDQNDKSNSNIFVRKSEELDSAIRSISCEQVSQVHEPVDVDICEIQPHALNQHELQSAVDSIL